MKSNQIRPISTSASTSNSAKTAYLAPKPGTQVNSIQARSHSGAATESEVRHRKMQSVRMILLNRPRQLNALTLSMVNSIAPQLKVWEESSLCQAIVITGATDRAFCAGGDVVSVVKAMESKDPMLLDNARDFFRNEYALNHHIGTLKKTIIAIWEGIVMGGGVGLSIHAPLRICTENTVFAMPEADIGFFPDVGGSFFLPRMDGELGTYLALTSDSLRGEENFLAGTATHYVSKHRLAALLEQLKEIEVGELDVINQTIEDFCSSPSLDRFREWRLGGDVARAIDSIFKHDTVEEIVADLERHIKKEVQCSPRVHEFCVKALDKMKTKSPLSLKVTLRQLRLGKKSDFATCFEREFQMAQRFMTKSDFQVGVTHKLIEKKKDVAPWSTPFERLSEITDKDVDYFFPPIRGGNQQNTNRNNNTQNGSNKDLLTLSSKITYWDYPHRPLSGLPTRQDLRRVISGKAQRLRTMNGMRNTEEAVGWLENNWGSLDSSVMFIQGTSKQPFPITIQGGFGRGKIGLKEKTRSTLEAFTRVGEDGYLEWIE